MARKRLAPKGVQSEAAGVPNVVETGEAPRPTLPKSKFSMDTAPKGWEAASQVLKMVSAVRTIFPDFNLGTKVAGLPTDRIITVHGPTHGGKSIWVIGLIISFLLGGHAAAYIDAEHSTPLDLMRKLFQAFFGVPMEQVPGFFAERPKTYEETISKVDAFLGWVKEQRKENPELRSIIVVDSINKLTPKAELAALLAAPAEGDGGGKYDKKKGGDAINKGYGRMRAAINQAWLDHIVPLLGEAGCSLVLIAQERDGEEGMPWETDMMDVFQIKGGAALKFDASLLCRVTKVKPVKDGEGKDAPVKAWEHNVRVWKSKVGAMDGRWTDTKFYIKLDGTFDVVRMLVEADVSNGLGVINVSGAWYGFGKYRKQGKESFIAALEKDREAVDALAVDLGEAVDKACKAAA